jgi:hypothetical protein
MKCNSLERHIALASILLLSQILFLTGCLPFITASAKVVNVSNEQPYKSFIGKDIFAQKAGTLWNDGLRLEAGEEVLANKTSLNKIADIPIGTKININSVKDKRTTTEMGISHSVTATCTFFYKAVAK